MVRVSRESTGLRIRLRALLHDFRLFEPRREPGSPRLLFDLANTGQRQGIEVAQLYLEFPSSAGEPSKRLAGWARVELALFVSGVACRSRRIHYAFESGILTPANGITRLGAIACTSALRRASCRWRTRSKSPARRIRQHGAIRMGKENRPLRGPIRAFAHICVLIAGLSASIRPAAAETVRLLPPRVFRQQQPARGVLAEQRGRH
jgi:hypothetical protein